MSMEVELNGKGGQVCKHAKAGAIQCPLIVRPTSEDVVTGNVVGALQHVRPHLWLNAMLNIAIDGDDRSGRFSQVWFRDFKVKLWCRQPQFPPEMLSFPEGRSEPDVIIEWENPPTSVWIEAKWLSPMATRTNGSARNDQVVRGVRTLMVDTGHIRPSRLFHAPRRRAVWIALVVSPEDDVLQNYDGSRQIMSVVSDQIGGTGDAVTPPDYGVLTWRDLAEVARSPRRWAVVAERSMLRQVASYLDHKLDMITGLG